MEKQSFLSKMIGEMIQKGNLPALDETLIEISRIASSKEASLSELSAAIMRDCGIVKSLLSTVNSSFYAPRFPIKTITGAVTYLGFEKVALLAFSLGFFRNVVGNLRREKMLKLYAVSYISGLLSMALSKEYKHDNPEEIFVYGLLYRIPYISLAHTYIDRFVDMERKILEDEHSLDEACLDVFKIKYYDICKAVFQYFNVPAEIINSLCDRNTCDENVILILEESVNISAMLFGDRKAGKHALNSAEIRIKRILNQEIFSLTDFIRKTLIDDDNVRSFFNLSRDDIEMLISILIWGKASPMKIVSNISLGVSFDEPELVDAPEALIGYFLTEIELCLRGKEDLNEIFMLSQEALFRCLKSAEVFLAFQSADKEMIQGRFYAGTLANICAQDFYINARNTESSIINCFSKKLPAFWNTGDPSLGLPYHPFGRINFKQVYLSPVVVRNQSIGICFVGRIDESEFNEREIVWIDNIVAKISKAFDRPRN